MPSALVATEPFLEDSPDEILAEDEPVEEAAAEEALAEEALPEEAPPPKAKVKKAKAMPKTTPKSAPRSQGQRPQVARALVLVLRRPRAGARVALSPR